MSTYRGTADRSSRAKAIAGVALIHAGLAAAILTGLNVEIVERVVDRLQTIDIRLPPPPKPDPPPAPAREAKRVELEEGAAGKKAEPSPIVAPQPRIAVESPLPAAPIAGTGSASSAGAAEAGTGTGAGGAGSGRGGGGIDYSRFTPARLTRNLGRGDYHALAAGRLPSGRAMLALALDPSGRPVECQVIRSSGDAMVDRGLCPLVMSRLRFRPALDDRGRPITYRLNYVATWRL